MWSSRIFSAFRVALCKSTCFSDSWWNDLGRYIFQGQAAHIQDRPRQYTAISRIFTPYASWASLRRNAWWYIYIYKPVAAYCSYIGLQYQKFMTWNTFIGVNPLDVLFCSTTVTCGPNNTANDVNVNSNRIEYDLTWLYVYRTRLGVGTYMDRWIFTRLHHTTWKCLSKHL